MNPSQRSMQRRSPGAEPGPPPSVPARAISPGVGMQLRASNASSRSAQSGGSMNKRTNVSVFFFSLVTCFPYDFDRAFRRQKLFV